MSNASQTDMLNQIAEIARSNGLTVTDASKNECRAEQVSIRAKWFLGGRKVTHRIAARLVEAERVVILREVVQENSWGIPPPTLTVERQTISGKALSGTRTDRSLGGGGGSIDYGAVRQAIEQAATAGGWTLRIELRLP